MEGLPLLLIRVLHMHVSLFEAPSFSENTWLTKFRKSCIIIKVVRPLDEAQNTIIKYIKVKELNKLKKQYTAQKK